MTTHILLTGATGMLGSEILYTLLADKLTRGRHISLSVLVRPKAGLSAKERVLDLLSKATTPYFLSPFSGEELLQHISVFEGDCLYIPESLIKANASRHFTLIHAAGTKNFGQTEKARQFVWRQDYQATLRMTRSLGKDLSKLIYISSAFSSGIRSGLIGDDFLSLAEESLTFRNHHEYYKRQTERAIVALAQQFGFSYTIARPSMLCGRLLFAPTYHARNYSGLYQIGAFCKHMNHKQIPLRIYLAENTSLNIIPVDYVALAICRLIDRPIFQINLVASNATHLKPLIEDMIQQAGLRAYSFTSRPYSPQNPIERQYVKTVGDTLSCYVNSKGNASFDPCTVHSLMAGIKNPMVGKHFAAMYRYAQELAFGQITQEPTQSRLSLAA